MHNYSIAEAKNSLSRIIHETEDGQTVHLTRRGELVAVLLSADEYHKINKKILPPANALQNFLDNDSYKDTDVDPTVFKGLRTKKSGRDIQL